MVQSGENLGARPKPMPDSAESGPEARGWCKTRETRQEQMGLARREFFGLVLLVEAGGVVRSLGGEVWSGFEAWIVVAKFPRLTQR